MENEFLDSDGYPSDQALDKIASWDYNDPKGWFEFIRELWHLRSWGWTEGYFKDSIYDPEKYTYHISTAGWSGNEDIIRAMQTHPILWDNAWLETRRGGHYVFELNP